MIIAASELAAAARARLDEMYRREAEEVLQGAPGNYEAYQNSLGYLTAVRRMSEWFDQVVAHDGHLEGVKVPCR